MPNEDDKTKPLYDLEELSSNNQIFEMESKTEVYKNPLGEPPEMKPLEKPKKEKLGDRIKNWWKKLSKKQKGFFIGGLVLFLILIGVGLFFLFKSFKKEETPIKPPDVIVQEENYRYENGKLVFLNANKEEIGSYTCQNANENLCFVAYYSNEDEFDVARKIYQDQSKIKVRSGIINEKYVFVSDNPRETDTTLVLYDMKEEKTEETYTLVKNVASNKNLYILKNTEGLYGILDFSGEAPTSKMDFKWSYLGYVENPNQYFVASEGLHQLLLKEDGSSVSTPLQGKIKNLNGSYVKLVNAEGKYDVFDFKGKKVFDDSFQYVELFEEYVGLVLDGKLHLRYYDKNKMNEEGIELKTNQFVKESIYDDENQLIETKEAFSLEEHNHLITVHVGEAATTINKLEGELSKRLKFVNYFDGKLYFYSDQDKKEFLGTYICSNKNNVKSGDQTLGNCSIASDTIFEENDFEIPGKTGKIPIFNERFVFINDNPDLVNEDNKTIVLYDLKKNTQLGKYMEVATYSYTGTDEITFRTVNDLQVVAKNKSGKYGVIKIGLSEVSGQINFNYNEIESLNEYYVAKDATGYLLLKKKDGSGVTSAIPYKIRNYNEKNKIVKIKNNDKYFLRDFQGKEITLEEKNGYAYIELYDEFFAAVDSNNTLKLFTYDKPKNNLIKDKPIQLTSKNYYGNGTLAFKISVNALEYEIFVGTSDNNYKSEYKGQFEKEER